MICPKVNGFYEYKGEICLEEGQLVVKNDCTVYGSSIAHHFVMTTLHRS